jgi:hypothetical protein
VKGVTFIAMENFFFTIDLAQNMTVCEEIKNYERNDIHQDN